MMKAKPRPGNTTIIQPYNEIMYSCYTNNSKQQRASSAFKEKYDE